jgi:hypothetical protein
MLNPFKDVHWNPDLAERKKFARSLMIGFPVIALSLATFTRLSSHTWQPFFLWLGVLGFAAGAVLWRLPQIARPFYVIWYFLGCCIGIVMGNLLFALFYYLLLTPMGLMMRLAGRDPLRKKFDRSTPTYWRDAEKVVDVKRYYRQF